MIIGKGFNGCGTDVISEKFHTHVFHCTYKLSDNEYILFLLCKQQLPKKKVLLRKLCVNHIQTGIKNHRFDYYAAFRSFTYKSAILTIKFSQIQQYCIFTNCQVSAFSLKQ